MFSPNAMMWQIATKCYNFSMSKSVRISDELYDDALSCATLRHRSLNQQLEHWAALGRMVEQSLTGNELLSALIQYQHELDANAVKSGKMRPERMYLIPPEDAKKMKIRLSAAALHEFPLK
jgi:hypothetical protein